MSNKTTQPNSSDPYSVPPNLTVRRLGVVSRDYNFRYSNGYRDFSSRLKDVLTVLDDKKCDTALFSLFGVVPRKFFEVCSALTDLKNIKAVLLEEFHDTQPRVAKRFVVYHRGVKGWECYTLYQHFGTLAAVSSDIITGFVRSEMPNRVMGNCCVLLCGEINGVKYSPQDKKIHDVYGLRRAIPDAVHIVLNPIHDKMTRFEMKLKRQFLSEKGRWVISVWNKGKEDRNGRVKDGYLPPWTAYCNGVERTISPISNSFDDEMGIIDLIV